MITNTDAIHDDLRAEIIKLKDELSWLKELNREMVEALKTVCTTKCKDADNVIGSYYNTVACDGNACPVWCALYTAEEVKGNESKRSESSNKKKLGSIRSYEGDQRKDRRG